MKGREPIDELSQLQKHYKVQIMSNLKVPGDVGERCLVTLTPDTLQSA